MIEMRGAEKNGGTIGRAAEAGVGAGRATLPRAGVEGMIEMRCAETNGGTRTSGGAGGGAGRVWQTAGVEGMIEGMSAVGRGVTITRNPRNAGS